MYNILVEEKSIPVVAIQTLGCKLNQAESETLARSFAEKGFRLGAPDENCDVFILNTCTVTHVADRKARHLLRLARRQNPGAFIVATGCLAERAPEQFGDIKNADLVVGNAGKEDLPSKIEQLLKTPIPPPARTTTPDMSQWGRTRAMVKIQEGCSQSCSYCIVPSVRGKGKSVGPDQVREQIKSLVAQGYREIVLTGTDIGSYKGDGLNLTGLLRSLLEHTTVERLRISSLQAQEITPELVSLWQDPRLCRHVHMPLQSGSDAVLRLMNRHYDSARVRQAAAMLRERCPDMAITTDIIVGFPGESEADFAQTVSLCQELRPARIHAFPYSPRPGTAAAAMTPRVDSKIQNERLARMLTPAGENGLRFRESFLGQTLPVLWERPIKGEKDLWSGLTGNYIRVYTRTGDDLHNRIIPAKLTGIKDGKVFGDIE